MLENTALYQLEVKLPSENGVTKTQVIQLKGTEQLWYSKRADFPEQGNTLLLYIATDEKKIYIWIDGDYMVLSGSADDLLGRLDRIEAEMVGKTEYNNHTHAYTPSGTIKEAVIESLTVTTGDITEVIEVGKMPEFGTEYNDDNKTLAFLWTPGVEMKVGSKTVITGVEEHKVTPTFVGTQGLTNEPN